MKREKKNKRNCINCYVYHQEKEKSKENSKKFVQSSFVL